MQATRTWIWIAASLVGATVLLAAPRQDEDDEPVKDGKWLYARHCAGCHNDNGDGKGATITQLGLVARDFAQGGFAFGDSREQMKRTIASGIPGRSPMPSFKGVLEDGEMDLVIEHVRTLMPKRDETPPKNTEMIVKDRPVIARGKLPPIADGAKEVPRGLLVGTPEGLTFEYDLSDVKLLGVRMGRFADREDWGDRGGAYLKPLGKLVWLGRDVDMRVRLEPYPNPGVEPFGELIPVLTSTRLSAAGPEVAYGLWDKASDSRAAAVVESLETLTTSIGPGYRRTWRFKTAPGVIPELILAFECRSVPAARSNAFWHLVDRGEQGTDAFWLTTDAKMSGTESKLQATVVRVPQWKSELAAQLEKELGL